MHAHAQGVNVLAHFLSHECKLKPCACLLRPSISMALHEKFVGSSILSYELISKIS